MTKILTVCFLIFISFNIFSGTIIVNVVDKKTGEPINDTLVSLKETKTSNVIKDKTVNGKIEINKLNSGRYLIKAEKKNYQTKTGKMLLDFEKKNVYTVSFKLNKSNLDSEINLKNIFKKDEKYFSMLEKEKALSEEADSETELEELGILRSGIACGLYEKSLSQNSSKLYELAYQYAESGTELTPLSPYTWEIFGIINSAAADSYKASIIAEDAFETCIKLAPENIKVIKMLADLYYRNEQFNKASQILEEKMLIEKKSPLSSDLALLNLCYIRGGNTEEGIDFFKLLSRNHPENQYIKLQLSILYNFCNKKQKAQKLLNSIISSTAVTDEQKKYAEKLLVINR